MNELLQLSEAELRARLETAKQELLGWEEKIMVGKETNHSKLREYRRNIARILTALQNKKDKAH